ncbi:MAG: P-type DNA transfer ATPase VirB11 [Gammaproteobacteria bacterium]|nr:P-type DNA transfer ATPase VirB11 [Gammaproteobacteria bacterium]MBL4729707.1 P-type DNA transfer ATPase VirB11 [Gammaproteobacteria bacterium]
MSLTNNNSYTPILAYLEKFDEYLSQPGVEEVMVNGPAKIFVEKAGAGIKQHENLLIDMQFLESFSQLVATYSNQTINEKATLLSASLPTGERIQIVRPPSCESNMIYLSIRKPNPANLTLEDMEKAGGLITRTFGTSKSTENNGELQNKLSSKDIAGFLKLAVLSRKNIVISGGTSSGKTTLANAMMKVIPMHERIITIEDVREVDILQPNAVHLLASKGRQGTSTAGIGELFAACLRLRPDRIMLSEIRGKEAYDFLNSVTSGHPGSITTVHADSIRYAVERLSRYIGDHESGRSITNPEIYVRQCVDVFIQVNKNSEDGWRGITDIQFLTHE